MHRLLQKPLVLIRALCDRRDTMVTKRPDREWDKLVQRFSTGAGPVAPRRGRRGGGGGGGGGGTRPSPGGGHDQRVRFSGICPSPSPPSKNPNKYYSGKCHVKFGHCANFSYIYIFGKNVLSPKLTELLCL